MGNLLLGVAIGIIIASLVGFLLGVPSVGTLLVRHIPGEEPYLFLDLDKDVGHILSKKYVILKIGRK